ncbi:MAG: DUF4912 domain-containing protein [Terrimicrobiaceae bacterium]|nr:DUF4912 domain-containing protein [Terrimicrobiaceae bacterium]
MKKAIAGESVSELSKKPKRVSDKKSMTGKPGGETLPPMEDLGDLPRSYGMDSIFLVAQEPHWLFTYWDVDISLHPGGKTFLRLFGAGERVETEIEVPFETRNWYIPVNDAGSEYTVEIGYYRGNQWKGIARSITVKTPKDKISESEDFDYATVPLHLSFQRLMENIQTTIQGGENLLQALGRLQRDGKLLALAHGMDLTNNPDERVVLEALLGKSLLDELSRSAMNSGELASRIQKHLQERLHSEGASEMMAKLPWGPSGSSLSSAFSSLAGPTSWSSAALSSWAAAALSSWAAAARSSPAPGESSWGSAAQSSWGAAALSSWLAAAKSVESSWNAAALSSWLQAVTSSWSGAALSSWSQAALSSWSHVETSSWGGSENLGSFGFAQREFFLHVNAEVIFYGGTHPQAEVTIDGKPVELAPDGSFRYHFVFPDGNYEIPVTATSPDGAETRSATLRFERTTARAGDVGHTGQPPLAVPMGGTV